MAQACATCNHTQIELETTAQQTAMIVSNLIVVLAVISHCCKKVRNYDQLGASQQLRPIVSTFAGKAALLGCRYPSRALDSMNETKVRSGGL